MTLTTELTEKEISALEAKLAKAKADQATTEEALSKAYEHRKLAGIGKVNDLIAELKLTVDDVASIALVQMAIKKAVKGSTKAPASGKAGKTDYVTPEPKWRFADGSEYAGGRGKKPNWVKEAEAAGTLDNYLIKKTV